MKTTLKVIGGIILVYIIVYSCNSFISNTVDDQVQNSPVMEKMRAQLEVQRVAEVLNQNLPTEVDEYTRLEEVIYDYDENLLTFQYTIDGLSLEDLGGGSTENVISNFKSDQVTYITSNPNNEAYLKAEVTYEYLYNDSQGKEMFRYRIEPSEYL